MERLFNFNQRYQEFIQFIRFVTWHFIADDCLYRASALAFTSILSIVPLMSVGLSILSVFPAFQNIAKPLQDFIFLNFVPTTGAVIQEYLAQFSAQVTKLSLWGFLFLIVTTILTMVTIDRSLNKIWRVKTPRQGVTAFLLYWSILSLGPLFLGLSLAASSYIMSMPFFHSVSNPSFLLSTIPLLFSLIGFTFLYVVVPNRPVKFIHGLLGALFATLFFEVAKASFAFYLRHYNSYELIYGAFATLPIFFVWVYWVWVIILIGAEISYALSAPYYRRPGPALGGFLHSLLWLKILWGGQRNKKNLTLEELIQSDKAAYRIDPTDILGVLLEQKLIYITADCRYILGQDLEELSLYDLFEILPYPFPSREELIHAALDPQWKELLLEIHKNLGKNLNIKLSHLFTS